MLLYKQTRLFLLVFLLANTCIHAQSLENKIDSLIAGVFTDPDGPGGVFMVAQKGQPIYQKAVGKANLEWNIDLNTRSVFQLGSMTKQFTAIAILQLEAQGKLQVSDTLSKFIPDYPNGRNITLHHLLTHTSGIRDFTKMNALRDIAQKEMTPEMMVDFFKNEPVDFLPGEKFEYNNSGYVLLGYIIEIVSGENYENYIRTNIFEKAGMQQSRYASDRPIVPQRAYGYHKKASGYVNKTQINFSVPFASGALMATTGDLLKWQNALNDNTLLPAGQLQKAFSKHWLNNGETITYGYGWHLKELNGVATREHGGSIFGFKTMGVYFPEADIYVVGLSNCDCNSPTQLVRDIASIALVALSNKK